MNCKQRNFFVKYRAIIVITLLSAFLNIYGIWKLGFANLYYSSAVYSMGKSFHAFLFNSIDSVGFISVDKPPLGFWIQVLFTKIFGFTGFAILLPEAIAGIISVILIYIIIFKRFGNIPACFSAITLALTPIFVAVCRNNTIDSILILVLLLASEFTIKSIEKHKPIYFIIAGFLIGIGFNIKMLQAYIIVPAVYFTYILCSKQKMGKRLLSVLLSLTVLIITSLSWITFVDLTPENERPYVGSSSTNSEYDLALGYNGIKRVIGGVFGNMQGKGGEPPMQGSGNFGGPNPELGNKQNNMGQPPQPKNNNNNDIDNYDPSKNSNDEQNTKQFNMPPNGNMKDFEKAKGMMEEIGGPNAKSMMGKGMGSIGGEAGETSICRLFNSKNSGQISWFLLPSFIFLVLAVLFLINNKRKKIDFNPVIVYFVSAFIPLFIYFSFASGLAHRYYFACFAPFIAGIVGIGVFLLKEDSKKNRILSAIVFSLTAITELFIQFQYSWLPKLVYMIIAILLISAVIFSLIIIKKGYKKLLLFFFVPLYILPAIWSVSPIFYGDNTQIPITGPELSTTNIMKKFQNSNDCSKLINYLEENRDGAKYLLATPSSMEMGSNIILESGEPVMCLSGFNGQDKAISVNDFEELCNNGTVKYALIGGMSNSEISEWIENNGEKIDNQDCGLGDSMYSLYKVGR